MKRKLSKGFNYRVFLGLLLLIIFFLQLSSSFFSASSVPLPPPTTTELRGVWLTNVSSGVLFAPWGINRAIKKLSELHFNTIYPVVWNRGHTFYPSAVAQSVSGKVEDPFLTTMRGGSDIMAETIRQAHQEGLSVIPWFEYGFMVPDTSKIAKSHPEWLTQTQAGKTILSENKADEEFLKTTDSDKANPIERWVRSQKSKTTIQQVWLNPLHPEVQQFIKDLIVEVAINYEVEGIQLDDHFGMPVELGYDPYSIKLYQQEHRGKSPPDNPHDPEWMRWRAAKLTAFMTQLSEIIRTVRPSAKVSLSPNSHYFSYQNYLQDWKTWVERGLIDELILQVYRNDLESFEKELRQPAVEFARHKIPVSVGILTGTWNRPIDIKQIEQQVKIVRDRGLNGVSFFYWETLWGYLTPESPKQRRQAFRSLFAQPAVRPKVDRYLT